MPDVITLPVNFDASSLPATLSRAVNDAQSRMREIKLKFDARPLGTISRDLSQFDKSLEASNARVLAFGASVGIISGVSEAFRSMISSTVEVEKSITSIQTVLNATSKNLQTFTTQLFDVAKNTGQSFDTVATAAQEFSRQGLGMTEIIKRTNDALILSRQSGLSAAESVEDLTAAINTFKREALDSTAIINKLANVDAAFAVSSGDLAEAIKRAGASAQDAKVGFNQLIAIVTAAQQITARGGSVIGNSFKTIFERINKGSTLDALEELNVKVRDLQGNTLPAITILQNLANRFDSLSDAQKNSTAQLVGGLYQINVLRATLGDLSSGMSEYKRALDIASSSTDQAIERNKALNSTFSALANKASLDLKQLFASIGKQSIEPLGKTVLGAFDSLFDSSKGSGKSSSFGTKFGQGLVNGFADFLKGPAVVLVGAIVFKLFENAAKSAQSAFKSIASFNSNIEKQQAVQEGINRVMQSGNAVYQARIASAVSVKEQEEIVLKILQEENAALAVRGSKFASASANLSGSVSFGNQGTSSTIAAQGYIPAYAKEEDAIRRGIGGVSRAANPVELSNFNLGGGKRANVIANSQEFIVKNYAGGDGSAIFNPDMVRRVGGLDKLKKLGNVQAVNAAGGLLSEFRGIPYDQIVKNLKNTALKGSFFRDFYEDYAALNPLKGKDRTIFNSIYAGQSGGGTPDPVIFRSSVNIFNRRKFVADHLLDDPYEYFNELKENGRGVNPYYYKNGKKITVALEKGLSGQEYRGILANLREKFGDVKDGNRINSLRNALQGNEPTSQKFNTYFRALEGSKSAPADRHVIGASLNLPGAVSEKAQKLKPEEFNTLVGALHDTLGELSPFGFRDASQVQASIFGHRATTKKFTPSLDTFRRDFARLQFAQGYNPLTDAIEREHKAGLPLGKIYVDKVKTPVYSGLVVGNTRDEPTHDDLVNEVNSRGVPNYARTIPSTTNLPDYTLLIEEALKRFTRNLEKTNARLEFADKSRDLTPENRGGLRHEFIRDYLGDRGLQGIPISQIIKNRPDVYNDARSAANARLQQRDFEKSLQDAVIKSNQRTPLSRIPLVGNVVDDVYRAVRPDRTFSNVNPKTDAQRIDLENLLLERRNNRASRLQNRGFQASFLLPLISGEVQSFAGVDPNTRNGRAISGVNSSVTSGLSIASLVPNQYGVALGGVIAGLGTLKALTDNVARSFEDLQKNLNDSNAKRDNEAQTIGNVAQAFANLQKVIEDNGSPEEISAAKTNLSRVRGEVPSKFRDQVDRAIASNDPQQLLAVTNSRGAEAGRVRTLNNIQAFVAKSNEEDGYFGKDRGFANLFVGRRASAVQAAGRSDFKSLLQRARTSVGRTLFGDSQDDNGNLDVLNKSLEQVNGLGLTDAQIKKVQSERSSGGIDAGLRKLLSEGGYSDKEIEDNSGGGFIGAIKTRTLNDPAKLEQQEKIYYDALIKATKADNEKLAAISETNFKKNQANQLLDNLITKGIANNSIVSLRAQNSRDLSLGNAKGFFEANRDLFSKRGQADADLSLGKIGVANDYQNQIEGLRGELLSSLPKSLPNASSIPFLRDQVLKQFASIVQNPNTTPSGIQNLLKTITDNKFSNTEGKGEDSAGIGKTDEYTKGLQDKLTEIVSKATEIREKSDQQIRVLEQQRSLQEVQIRNEERASVLGGDFRKFQEVDFSKAFAGFAASRTLGTLPRISSFADERRFNSLRSTQAAGNLDLLNQGLITSNGAKDAIRSQIAAATEGGLRDKIGDLIRNRNTPNDVRSELLNSYRDVGNIAQIQAAKLVPFDSSSKGQIPAELQERISFARKNATGSAEQNTQIIAQEIQKVSANTQSIDETLKAIAGLDDKKPDAPVANKAEGHVPYVNREVDAIRRGIGGALPYDRPLVRNVSGLGNVVVNSGEKIVQNFLGTGKSAILTRDMQKFVPNFAATTPIFGQKFAERLLKAKKSGNLLVSAETGLSTAKSYKDEKALIPSLTYALQGKANEFLLTRQGYRPFIFSNDKEHGTSYDQLIRDTAKKGQVKSDAFLFSTDSPGGRNFISQNFKRGKYLAPELNITKLQEAQLSKYLPSSERFSETVARSGSPFRKFIGTSYTDRILKPIEGLQSQGIIAPGEIIPKLDPAKYINQEVYAGLAERSFSRSALGFAQNVAGLSQEQLSYAYLLPQKYQNSLGARLLNRFENTKVGLGIRNRINAFSANNHLGDYSGLFSADEYRSHVATDFEGGVNTVRYSTANKNSPFRSLFANLYESQKIKAVERAANNAVSGLPESVRRNGQVFGVDVLRVGPEEAARINALHGIERATSYNRSFLERLFRGNFSQKTGHFAPIELNPTNLEGSSGNATHFLETQAFLAGAEGRTPLHALDQPSTIKQLLGLLSNKAVKTVSSFGLARNRGQRAFANAGIFDDILGFGSRALNGFATDTADKLRYGLTTGAELGLKGLSATGTFASKYARGFASPLQATKNIFGGNSFYSRFFGSSLGSTASKLKNVTLGESLASPFKLLKAPFSFLGGAFKDGKQAFTGIGALGKFQGAAKLLGRLGTVGILASTISDLANVAGSADQSERNGLIAKAGVNIGSFGLTPVGQLALAGGSLLGSLADKGIGAASEALFGQTAFSDNLKRTSINGNFLSQIAQQGTQAVSEVQEAREKGVKESLLNLFNPFADNNAVAEGLSKKEFEKIQKEFHERHPKGDAPALVTNTTATPKASLVPAADDSIAKAREKYIAKLNDRIDNYYGSDARPEGERQNIQNELARLKKGIDAKKETAAGTIDYYSGKYDELNRKIGQEEYLDESIALPDHRGLVSRRSQNEAFASENVSKGIGRQTPYEQPESISTEKRFTLLPGQIGVDENGQPIFDKETTRKRNSLISQNLPNAARGFIPNFADSLGIGYGSSHRISERAFTEDEQRQYEFFLKKQRERQIQAEKDRPLLQRLTPIIGSGFGFGGGRRGFGGALGDNGGLNRGAYGQHATFYRSAAQRKFDQVQVPDRTTADLILSGVIGGQVNGQNLQESIQREQEALNARGYYASGLIQVGYSPRIGGLGVYNKIDEPFGLEQGINRVARQGGNPKVAGTVPNFADAAAGLTEAINTLQGKIGGTSSNNTTVDVNHEHVLNLSINGSIHSAHADVGRIASEELGNFKNSFESRLRDLEVSHSKTNPSFKLRPQG